MLYEFSERDTLIHRLDPRTKLFLAFCFTFLSIVIGTPKGLALLLLVLVLYGAIGGLYPWHYRNIIYLLIPFAIAITAIQILVARSVQPLPALNLFGLSIPVRGLELGLSIALRAIVLGISFGLFMMATHPTELAQAAVEMGVPFRYGYMVSFALRFLPLAQEDLQKIRQAQASRGLDENRLGPLTRFISLPALLFPLIMTVLRHSQSIAVALEMRGLSTGSTYGRTFLKDVRMKPADWFVIGLAVLGVASTIVARIAGLIK